jgi:hypothetical protein
MPYERTSVSTLLTIRKECDRYARQGGAYELHQSWKGSKDKLDEPILDQEGEMKQWASFLRFRHRWPALGYGVIFCSGPLEAQTRERVRTWVAL